MVKEIQITATPAEEKNSAIINSKLFESLKKSGINTFNKEVQFIQNKRSIDARHGKVKLFLKYTAYIGEPAPDPNTNLLPKWINIKNANSKFCGKTVIIVGGGPAGIFAALKLLEKGIKPVIIERGSDTQTRKRDIAAISTKHIVDENSNYCFGEGGAGTFSDGKLFTRSSKRGNVGRIMQIFTHFGADPKIITDAHPHIGTNKLPAIINSMNKLIIESGGEIYFNTKVISFNIQKSVEYSTCVKYSTCKNICNGIKTVNTKTGEEKIFTAHKIILATGHSATDIYMILAKEFPESLEAKTFAVGMRVEHPREIIDKIQYKDNAKNMNAAEYRLACQQEDRGVYSFCMCPGGFVVPSATGPNQIVVNGMSAAARNSLWSNAAIVVETRPQDIPQEFEQKAEQAGTKEIKGLLWRTWLEELTYQNGNKQQAPAQLLKDFLECKLSSELPRTSYTPGIVSSNIAKWFPEQLTKRLIPGFRQFNNLMKGFICDQALLIASETRTSTPVRIKRDDKTYECVAVKNLFPCGEGSGYSGGIVSSAMDGENAAEKIIECFEKN